MIKRFLTTSVVLFLCVQLLIPTAASAATVEELQALICSLQAQIAQLTGQPVVPCGVVISNGPTMTAIVAPTLAMTYNSARQEATLSGNAQVKINAGSRDICIQAEGIYMVADSGRYTAGNGSSTILDGASLTKEGCMWTNPGEKPTTMIGYYRLPAGKSATFMVSANWNPNQMFAGTYTARVQTAYVLDNQYTSLQSNMVSKPITIVGERAPYISSISAVPGLVTIKGERIMYEGSSPDQMVLNGASYPIAKIATGVYTAQIPSTLRGSFHPVYLKSVRGNSNNVNVIISASTTSATLKVTTPNGGENYKTGDTIKVTWGYPFEKSVDMYVMLYSPISATVPGYKFHIGTNLSGNWMDMKIGSDVPAGQYKVTVCDESRESTPGKPVCDSSDSYFEVSVPTNTSSITITNTIQSVVDNTNDDVRVNVSWKDSLLSPMCTSTPCDSSPLKYNILLRNSSGGQWPIEWAKIPNTITNGDKIYQWLVGSFAAGTATPPNGTYHITICHDFSAPCAKTNNFQLKLSGNQVTNTPPQVSLVSVDRTVSGERNDTMEAKFRFKITPKSDLKVLKLSNVTLKADKAGTSVPLNSATMLNVTSVGDIMKAGTEYVVDLYGVVTATTAGQYRIKVDSIKWVYADGSTYNQTSGLENFKTSYAVLLGSTSVPAPVVTPVPPSITFTSAVGSMVQGTTYNLTWTDPSAVSKYNILLRNSSGQQLAIAWAATPSKSGDTRSYSWEVGKLFDKSMMTPGHVYSFTICPLNSDNSSAGKCAVSSSTFQTVSAELGSATSNLQLANSLQAIANMIPALKAALGL